MGFTLKKDDSDAIISIGGLCLDRFEENIKGSPPNHCDDQQLGQLQREIRDNTSTLVFIQPNHRDFRLTPYSSWRTTATNLVRRVPYELTKPFAGMPKPTQEYCKSINTKSYKECALQLLPSAHYKIRDNTEHYFKG